MKAASKLKEAIKLVLDHDLMIDKGCITLYWASMGDAGDPAYIVCSDETLAKYVEEFYEEFDNFDDAFECFLQQTGIEL